MKYNPEVMLKIMPSINMVKYFFKRYLSENSHKKSSHKPEKKLECRAMGNQLVSIIVPARNEEKTIKKCVDSLLALKYEPREIIIVDDGSTDRTPEILASYGDQIKVLRLKGEGPSKARNDAIIEAKGSLIAFTDADCTVDTLWINELLKGFTQDSVVGVGGAQEVPQDESCFGRDTAEFLRIFGFTSDYIHKGSEIAQTRHNPTCNVIYRKEIFERIGGFNEALWPCEDLELDIRIGKKGFKLTNNPKAKVNHYRPSTYRGFLKMWYRYGLAHSKLNTIQGFTELIHYLPLFLAIYVVFNVLLYKYIGNYLLLFNIALFVLLYLAVFTVVRSIKKTFKIVGLLFSCIASWLSGYFVAAGRGLWKK